MSKRDLKKYLAELSKEQLAEQLMELYEKFPPVKVYYNFVFNPKEDTLLQDAKVKMSYEYFPIKKPGRRSRPKMRRSVAQKIIKHFILLGVDPFITADAMLYNIEVAQKFSAQNNIKYDTFYKSISNSFDQAVQFIIVNGIVSEYKERISTIHQQTVKQKWDNEYQFKSILERLED